MILLEPHIFWNNELGVPYFKTVIICERVNIISIAEVVIVFVVSPQEVRDFMKFG